MKTTNIKPYLNKYFFSKEIIPNSKPTHFIFKIGDEYLALNFDDLPVGVLYEKQ